MAGEALCQDQGPVVRRTVMEEFSGTLCGFCPRGIVGIERLQQDYPDRFIAIVIHQYKDTDPMYLTNYADLGFEEAPACMLDRQTLTGPYYGQTVSYTNVCYAIEQQFLACQTQEAWVDVAVSGTWTSDSRMQVNAVADVRFLAEAEGYSMAFVLTADSVASTSSSWLQSNYYSQDTPDYWGIPADDPLAAYCRGGERGQSYVPMVYNDVAIASTYVNGASKVDALPAHIQAGEEHQRAYRLSLPTKTLLKNALNKDHIYVVALVFDAQGHIANAARARVVREGESGIHTIPQDAPYPVSPSCDLLGRPVIHPTPGQPYVQGGQLRMVR